MGRDVSWMYEPEADGMMRVADDRVRIVNSRGRLCLCGKEFGDEYALEQHIRDSRRRHGKRDERV